MRISDWSSDVCSSDLSKAGPVQARAERHLLRKPLARVSRHRTNRMRKELQRRVNIERLPDQPHNERQNLQARAECAGRNKPVACQSRAFVEMIEHLAMETGRASWRERGWQYV